jgi:hypothetical protein
MVEGIENDRWILKDAAGEFRVQHAGSVPRRLQVRVVQLWQILPCPQGC